MTKYKELKEKRFVNPYHFVSLERNCRKNIDYRKQRKAKGVLTGRLKCEMKTLTPIFIPNSSSIYETDKGEKCSDVFGKRTKDNGIIKSYDFFSYTPLPAAPFGETPIAPEPVIPGSEIRGVIRSAFEAVTNSCLSTIDDEQVLYKRVTTSGKPGRLVYENGRWKIQKCERIGISFRPTRGDRHDFSKDIKTLKEGQEVYIKKGHKYKTKRGYPAFTVVDDVSRSGKNGFVKGYFHMGEPFGKRKHHESVFVPTGEEDIEIDEFAVKNYVKNLELYKDKTVNLHFKKGEHSGYNQIFVKNKPLAALNKSLVYYDKDEQSKNYYLSPSAIGREVFYNTLTKIVDDYKPCLKLNELCCACSLFGIAGKGEAATSRVRFTDAHVRDKEENPDDYYHGIRILKELASPKLSATEFYLGKNPEYADTWNYDYAVNWRPQKSGIREYKPRIRGRKFYWHQPHGDPFIKKEDEQNFDVVSERNVAVRPLQEEKYFEFDIYFNNITTQELGKLLWVLQIGQNKANAHKIGMGKPIGLGSVRISVSDVFVRTVSMENGSVRYSYCEYKPDRLPGVSIPEPSQMNHRALGCGESVLKEFLTVTEFEHPYEPVEYPTVEGKEENYLWFGANKQIKSTGTKPVIHQPLPPIDSPWLNKYKEKENRRAG